jgi:hypothetical protein
MDSRTARIEQATNDGLKYVSASDQPFLRVADFVLVLQDRPDWTREDVIEAAANIFARLRKLSNQES